MATINVEVLDCCRVGYARGLTDSEMLTVSISFLNTIRECRTGSALDEDGRLVLGAMVCEAARLLNATPKPKRRQIAANIVSVDFGRK